MALFRVVRDLGRLPSLHRPLFNIIPMFTHRNKYTNSYGENFVRAVFSNVATNYDLMNDLMSFGIHRIWKEIFVREVVYTLRNLNQQLCKSHFSDEKYKDNTNVRILDLAGGTGDISFRIVDYINNLMVRDSNGFIFPNSARITPEITVVDPSADMINIGRERCDAIGLGEFITWVKGEAESIPFDDNTFDIISVSFGLRNFTNIENGLRECYRVVKPGGRLLILEFSQCENDLMSALYDTYSKYVIPALGRYVAKDESSYTYLVDSIRKFPKQLELVNILTDLGFVHVSYKNLTCGIVAIHSCFKPT